ncbi:MAG TPA: hypothetical protein VG964_03825, partial [Candidatus Saccharimonadales bacterium]|nr:hypothetical protein [Candidatus Saccharimonadales bacterium]
QAWKDSAEFYIYADGRPANHAKPIASIEVQAIAYDALTLTAKLLPSWQSLKTKSWRLRARTIHLMWMPDKNYFGLGISYDDKNNHHLLDTITANPAEMLDSTFFDLLDEEDYQKYISAIVEMIMGEDFLTDAGIRSRALREASLVDMWDYHGSFTSWPKETYDIAKGLRRHGFPRLAEELENRLINAIRAAGSFPEFFYIDRRNRVLGVARSASSHGELMLVDSTNTPEKIQAWTVSAVLGIRRQRKAGISIVQKDWQRDLEKRVLRHMPHVREFKTKRELAARYPFYPYELQKGVGR